MVNYVAIDFETANDDFSSICQVGICIVKSENSIELYSTYVDPEDYFTNTYIHGIDQEKVKNSPKFPEIVEKINNIIGENFIIGYGGFDRVAFIQACEKYCINVPHYKWINAQNMVRRHWTQFARKGYNLGNIADFLSIENNNHHDAQNDAIVCSHIVNKILAESDKDINWWFNRVKHPIFTENKNNIQEQDINTDGDLFGKNILFTGELSISRSEATIIANKCGAKVTNSPSKNVDYLVVGNQDLRKTNGRELSNKHRKILELKQKGYNILIIKEDDFKILVNNDYESTKYKECKYDSYGEIKKDINVDGICVTITYYDKV